MLVSTSNPTDDSHLVACMCAVRCVVLLLYRYGRYKQSSTFRLTMASAVRVLASSPLKPNREGDWAAVALRATQTPSLANAKHRLAMNTAFAADAIADARASKFSRGRPPSDAGILFRTATKLTMLPSRVVGCAARAPEGLKPVDNDASEGSTAMAVVAFVATRMQTPEQESARARKRAAVLRNDSNDRLTAREKARLAQKSQRGDGVCVKVYMPNNSRGAAISLTAPEMTCVAAVALKRVTRCASSHTPLVPYRTGILRRLSPEIHGCVHGK